MFWGFKCRVIQQLSLSVFSSLIPKFCLFHLLLKPSKMEAKVFKASTPTSSVHNTLSKSSRPTSHLFSKTTIKPKPTYFLSTTARKHCLHLQASAISPIRYYFLCLWLHSLFSVIPRLFSIVIIIPNCRLCNFFSLWHLIDCRKKD